MADVARINARNAPKCSVPRGSDDFKGRERDLQEQIKQDLIARRWYVIGSRFGVKSTMDAGTPDIIAAGPNGVTLWIEVKKKGGKLSEEQTIVRHILLAHGHRYAVVYSFEDYLSLIITAISEPNQAKDRTQPG